MDLTITINLCRLFHFLARFLFTTSDTELDYYHNKKSLRIFSRVPQRLKPSDLRKFGNSRKSLKCLDLKVSIQVATLKSIFEVF